MPVTYGRVIVGKAEVHIIPKQDGEMNHLPRIACGCWPDKVYDRDEMKMVYLHRPTKKG